MKTTGDLLLGFRRTRRVAEDWIRALPVPGGPVLHLPPDRLPLGHVTPRGPVGIFPGSFDPPTEAHLRLARAALDRTPIRTLLLTFDLQNVDKAKHGLPLADRIALTAVAFRTEPRVGVAIASHGLFLEKVRAIRRKRWAREGIWFVLGADTMERILEPRYYRDPAREIPRLLEAARFAIFPREGRRPPPALPRGPGQRTLPLPLSPRLKRLSSTKVRGALRAGHLPLGDVPAEVLYSIGQYALYRRSRRPPAEVVTSFLMKGDRCLVLKRSGQVGSYQGKWAGVSGFFEWPLSRLRDLLRGRVTARDRRDQALRNAIREIREETGIRSDRLRLLRRGRVLAIPDKEFRRDWRIYPFLFAVDPGVTVRLDWEHTEARWIWPAEIEDLPTVPRLPRSLRTILPKRAWKRGRGSPRERARRIAQDRTGGAMEIFSRALSLTMEVAWWDPAGDDVLSRELDGLCKALLSGHPMAPMENLVEAIRKEMRRGDAPLAPRLRILTRRLRQSATRGTVRCLKEAGRALKGVERIATYSYSSAALLLLVHLGQRARIEVAVIRDGEGHSARLRERLRASGVRCRPFPGSLPGETDTVLLGCDAVYGRSSFLNAKGTGRIVKDALRQGIPIWVLAHPLKLLPRRPRRMDDPALEICSTRNVHLIK